MVDQPLSIYLEIGSKKTFAAGVNWPGWNRSGRDEQAARAALVEYGPRYALVIQNAAMNFMPPQGPEHLQVMERLAGNTTTDFGAPNVPLAADSAPIPEDELERLLVILSACWRALEQAARQAQGKSLRTGPRGGGRDLERMLRHVLEAEGGYLRTINWKAPPAAEEDLFAWIEHMRGQSADGLSTAVRQGLPEQGPRGGKFWLPRTYVRRSAWHILDHAWELEDRVVTV